MNRTTQFFALLALSLLLMSATKCEKKPEPRQLKKNISISTIEASTFMNSSAFNLAEQARERYSSAIFSSPYFHERYFYPTPYEYVKAASLPQMQTTIQKLMPKPNPLIKWFPQIYENNELKSYAFDGNSACLVTRPQHIISAKLLSLEAHSGGSLVFGFSQSFAQLPLQASFSVDRMKMDMVTNATNPWSKERIQSQISSVFKKDMKIKVGLDLGFINIGPEIYRKTGLAEVTQQLVSESVKNIGAALNATPGEEWKSRIIINQDNYVAIVGGEELGIRVGDQFIVENESHQWIGQPCGEDSILVSSLPVTLEPWIIEIDRVGSGISRAKVITKNENEQIQIGALVKIKKLFEESDPNEDPRR